MTDTSVLIVSRHPLLVQSIRLAVAESGIETVYHVEHVEEGLALARQALPATIIVEVDRDTRCEEVAARFMAAHTANYQVVCISLDSSDLTVIARYHVPRAGPADLVALLRHTDLSLIGERP